MQSAELRELIEVAGDIQGVLPSPMDAADATRGKYADAGNVGNNHGRSHRRCPVVAPAEQVGQVASAGFGNLMAATSEQFNLIGIQSASEPPSHYCTGGRNGAGIAHHLVKPVDVTALAQLLAELSA